MLDVYQRIEMPTALILERIERTGVLIDSALLAAQSQQLAERMVALEQQAYELAGQPFNLGSPKQIGDILFGKIGLPVKKKTASGAPSTDEEVLDELAADYPLPARLLEHRSLAKLKGTYTDKLPLMVNPAPPTLPPGSLIGETVSETPKPSRANFAAVWAASATPPMQLSAMTHSTGAPQE